jgi:hypothetical protein
VTTVWVARLCVAAVVFFAMSTAARAHGGVSMDNDICKLQLGPYYMHFAGYQVRPGLPDTEFCEDIPATGRTIIVMDAIDQELRDIPIRVQILGHRPDGEQYTVIELPAQIYRSGSVSLEHTFDQPGRFVGVVMAGADPVHTSQFPFSVGISRPPYAVYALLAAVVLGAAGLYRYTAMRRAKTATA